MAWWVVGCGEAPEPPTAVSPTPRVGAGSSGQTDTDVLTVRPSPDSMAVVPGAEEPSSGAPSDAGSKPAPQEAVRPAPRATVSAQVFSACRETRAVGCDALYLRMRSEKPDVCVQLVLDNCSENDRQGLPVALPLGWRLSSGSASTDLDCDLRQYDPKSQPVLTASGKVGWTTRVRQISNLDVDLVLRVDPPPAVDLPVEITLKTPAPIATVETCEG